MLKDLKILYHLFKMYCIGLPMIVALFVFPLLLTGMCIMMIIFGIGMFEVDTEFHMTVGIISIVLGIIGTFCITIPYITSFRDLVKDSISLLLLMNDYESFNKEFNKFIIGVKSGE